MVTRSLGQPMSRETIRVGARVLCVGSQVFVPVTDERFVCPQTLNISGQKKQQTLEDWVTLWMGSCYVHWNQSCVNRWVKCILFREPHYLNRFLILYYIILILLSGKSSVFFINIPRWLLQDVIVNLANNTFYIILSGSVSEPHYLFYMELRET